MSYSPVHLVYASTGEYIAFKQLEQVRMPPSPLPRR